MSVCWSLAGEFEDSRLFACRHAGNGRVGDGERTIFRAVRAKRVAAPLQESRRSPVHGEKPFSPSGASIMNNIPREGKRFLRIPPFFARRTQTA